MAAKKINKTDIQISLGDDLDNSLFAIWWYGGISQNKINRHQPNVKILCRKVNVDMTLTDEFFETSTNATNLKLLRIGDIRYKQAYKGKIAYEELQAYIDWSDFKFNYISIYDENNRGCYSGTYQLLGATSTPNRVNAITFRVIGHSKYEFITVPMLEFFMRTFGRSSELARILLTYDMHEIHTRICPPFESDDEIPLDILNDDHWVIKLPVNLTDRDSKFIASYKYTTDTQESVKHLAAALNVNHDGTTQNYIHPEIRPWHKQTVLVNVAGYNLDDHHFLALKLHLPKRLETPPITVIKHKIDPILIGVKNSNNNSPGGVIKELDLNLQTPISVRPNEGGINPTLVEFEDDDFYEEEEEIISKYYIQKNSTTSKKKYRYEKETTNQAGTGEPDSSHDKTANTNFEKSTVFESKGRLQDIWNSSLELQKYNPELITSVEYYHYEDNTFASTLPLIVTAFSTFEELDGNQSKELLDKHHRANRWVTLNQADKTNRRCILLIRFLIQEKYSYIFEIQPDPPKISDSTDRDAPQIINDEKGYSGLIFQMKNDNQLKEYLNELMSEIMLKEGGYRSEILSQHTLIDQAHIFKHSNAKNTTFLYASALRNAFSKIGIPIYIPITTAKSPRINNLSELE